MAWSTLSADHPLDVVIPGHNHISDLITLSGKPHSPATLDPNTTYYWQLWNEECCTFEPHLAKGKMWSFTTEGEIRAEASTWGKIKALYQ